MAMLDYQFDFSTPGKSNSARQSDGVIACDFAVLKKSQALNLVLRREFYAQGGTTGTHLHLDFCALYIVRGGRGAHVIDGIPFGIARGDVYVLPPGALHAYTDYRDLEIDAFYFPLSLWSEEELAALREFSGFWSLILESHPEAQARRLHLRPEAHRQAEAAIAEMRAEVTRDERATPLLLRAALFALLVSLSRAASHGHAAHEFPEREPLARGAEPNLAELISWCEKNVERDVSVAQLAGRLFVSPAHFAKLWKREVGVPPATYLRRLKLERAKSLLSGSKSSVAHIAREVGFESPAHFSRSFRACYGLSPQQFRQALKKR